MTAPDFQTIVERSGLSMAAVDGDRRPVLEGDEQIASTFLNISVTLGAGSDLGPGVLHTTGRCARFLLAPLATHPQNAHDVHAMLLDMQYLWILSLHWGPGVLHFRTWWQLGCQIGAAARETGYNS